MNSEQELINSAQENDVVLAVKGVSKKFCRSLKRSLFYGVTDIAGELLGIRGEKNELRREEFWALHDVSFELHRGEAIGLVGKNGSGKTTLLRIIAGLIKPDEGYVDIQGRTAPLIALGAGFDPILTGRENIYANMSILGLSKREIDERFDQVVDFAEIGEAIDAPVRSYSSGMAARLGFSCAVHTEPEILLIDEVLAVGDIRFRAKCERKLGELRQKGVSFILVSHKSQQVIQVCEKAIYLHLGQKIGEGESYNIVHQYEQDLFEVQKDSNTNIPSALSFSETDEDKEIGLSLKYIHFQDEKDNQLDALYTDEPASLCIGIKAYREIKDLNVRFKIKDLAGEGDLMYFSHRSDGQHLDILPGEHEIKIQYPSICLKPNYYSTFLSIKEGKLSSLLLLESFRFKVKSKKKLMPSIYYQPHSWDFNNIKGQLRNDYSAEKYLENPVELSD